ncbi:MAG: hypothetical protein Q7K55_09435 [Candidatus Levybacteria bacterium]|nr:hypothetical protein [Candidatus Levybacteria bacterium]
MVESFEQGNGQESLNPLLRERLLKAARPEQRGEVFTDAVLKFAAYVDTLLLDGTKDSIEIKMENLIIFKIQPEIPKYVNMGLSLKKVSQAFNIAVDTCFRFHNEQDALLGNPTLNR